LPLFGQGDLPLADLGAFLAIHPGRHELQVVEFAVEFGHHGTRDDVVHFDDVAGVRTSSDRRGVSLAKSRHSIVGETAEAFQDGQVSKQSGFLRISTRRSCVPRLPLRLVDDCRYVLAIASCRLHPVDDLLQPGISRPRPVEGVDLLWRDERGKDFRFPGGEDERSENQPQQGKNAGEHARRLSSCLPPANWLDGIPPNENTPASRGCFDFRRWRGNGR
jgi:hypothetical protein